MLQHKMKYEEGEKLLVHLMLNCLKKGLNIVHTGGRNVSKIIVVLGVDLWFLKIFLWNSLHELKDSMHNK